MEKMPKWADAVLVPRVGDKGVGPNPLHNRLFGNDIVVVMTEIDEDIHHLRFQLSAVPTVGDSVQTGLY